ncbi:PAS domain S-box protein [Halomicroarcula salina]|uniref:histidine kinase n=1 Tax=Haloarcula salina TaxID=1429914 RepID=A0AA41KCA8_9EURY|nr:PAS domain S-box protein [Haloarcula salina]
MLANKVVNAVERARAERARERHLEAIETAREGISILDESGEFIYVNDAYAGLYGYDPADLLGEHWEVLYRDEDIDRVWDEIIPQIDETGYWHGETIGVRADGSTFVEDHTLARTDHDELVCTVRDASDRRRREQAIEELHATARAFLQATTEDEIARITVESARDILDMPANAVHFADGDDGDLRPVAWTDRVEDIVGTPPVIGPGDGLAWEAFEAGEPRVHDDVSTNPGRFNSETDVRSELLLPLDDHGVLLVGSCEATAFDETDASLARMLAVHATTALDRLDRERELRAERAFVDQALDTLDDLFYVVGPEGDIRRWNDRVPAVTGYADAELAALSVTDLFPDDQVDAVVAAVDEALETGRTTVEADLRTADGERFPYEFTGARLTDPEGDRSGVVGIGRDITHRKAREERLARQNERLDEFTSVVSHDLRNPLALASGHLDLAREEYDSEHLETVADAHDRMRSLIEDLLTFAREGESATEVEPVSLGDAAADCWESVGTDAATLAVATDRRIRADPAKLRRLLENLFRNTVEHGSTNPRSHTREDAVEHGSTSSQNATRSDDAVERAGDVTVTVGDADGGFYVADDGPGIPADERDRVFETRYSGDADGTGFGLAIVRRIADDHGWTVSVTESEDGGARFEITGVGTA